MDIKNNNYIIIEIIPTTRSKYSGDIAQISALKIEGLKLIDRYDYRLNKDKILIPDILKIISYDDDKFKYLDTTNELLNHFYKWSENYPLIIIDNDYTNEFLSDLPNKKIAINDILKIEKCDNIIELLFNKYNIEPTNYIVDVMYESILKENI